MLHELLINLIIIFFKDIKISLIKFKEGKKERVSLLENKIISLFLL